MYWNTKLAIMPILPTMCVCEKPDCYRLQGNVMFSEARVILFLGGAGV